MKKAKNTGAVINDGRQHTTITSDILARAYDEAESGGSGYHFHHDECDLPTRADLSTPFMDVYYREDDDRFIVVCAERDSDGDTPSYWAVEVGPDGNSCPDPAP